MSCRVPCRRTSQRTCPVSLTNHCSSWGWSVPSSNSEQDQRFTGWSNAKDPPFSGTLRLRAREKSTRPSMERSRTRRRFNFWRKCIHSTKWCGRNANGTWSGACGNDRATGKSKQMKGRGRKRRRKRKRRISQSNRKNKQTRRRNPKRKRKRKRRSKSLKNKNQRSLLASDLPHQRDLPRNPPTNPKCRNSCHPASLRNYPAGMLVGSAVTTIAGRSGRHALVCQLLILDCFQFTILQRMSPRHANNSKKYVPLKWSNALKAEAAVWARHLATQGRLYHDTNKGPYGENLAMNSGGGGQPTTGNVLSRWVEDEANLNFPANGHLTQVLWRATEWVGCADAHSGNTHVQVCRYARPGNCNMANYNTWLEPMLMDESPCGATCHPRDC